MRILVTGGAGYVGSHCLRALCDAGHDVIVLDNLSNGHRQAVDPRAKLVIGDLADAELLDRLLGKERPEAVMHFAALAQVGESVREPIRYYENNVVGTLRLLDAMRHYEVRNFVFSSTCAVYGVPQRIPIPEDHSRAPISPYGRSKLCVEWLLEDSAMAWGLGATALRYFNAAGASGDGLIGEDHRSETHLIPCVLRVALGLEPRVSVFGDDYPTRDGSCIRDYVHVEDLAAIHAQAIVHQQPGRFQAYNVGTGMGVSVLEVLEAARKVTGQAIPAMTMPRRPGDPPELVADGGAARKRFGWTPRYTDIVQTVRTAWEWHRKNPQGYPRPPQGK